VSCCAIFCALLPEPLDLIQLVTFVHNVPAGD